MKFGTVPLAEAEGAILVHSLSLADGTLKKGATLGPAEIARLAASGYSEVTVAAPGPDDTPENEAAAILAASLGSETVRVEEAFTGRANLFARKAGVLRVSRAAIDAANRIDEAITVATLPDHAAVEEGRMIATVKIIPYAAPRNAVDRAREMLVGAGPVLEVAPFRPLRVAMVSTALPGTPAKVLDKTARTFAARLAPAGATIAVERRVPHETAALTAALEELRGRGHGLTVVFGASAIADRRDVIPAAIEAAGGTVEHFGMPVDPGNLLLVGRFDGAPVLGAPGCARSPKENGFDWVLQRLLAGLPVTREDITGLGVGGLLMEIVTRPQPRQGPAEPAAGRPSRVAAVLLAAGRSTRMGGPNKLLATLDGKPLVRIAAEAALGSRAGPVVVVTGHQAEAVEAALQGLDVRVVRNPDYAEGLSTSLRAGIAALPDDVDAALVCLADMPRITPELLDRLIAACDPGRDAHIVVPTVGGQRGNPVLWSRRFFDGLKAVDGDTGGKSLLAQHPEAIAEVAADDAVRHDLDTPEAVRAIGGEFGEGG